MILGEILRKLKFTFLRTRYLFPSRLPRSLPELQLFSDAILESYHLPKNNSYYHSIAVMIQHLPPTQVFKSKYWFARSLYNAEAREAAYYRIAQINEDKKDKPVV